MTCDFFHIVDFTTIVFLSEGNTQRLCDRVGRMPFGMRCQMQDLLGLGVESRMNTPGLLGSGNWQWRMLPGCLTEELAAKLLEMTRIYGRL